jgi:hypothetical protein
VATFTGVLVFQQLFSMFCYHLLPNAKADEFRGPFTLAAYVVPALAFALPAVIFTALTSSRSDCGGESRSSSSCCPWR